MCRLYAMHANEPTRVECGLVKSQNALMEQSKSDLSGYAHSHGWGVADYPDGVPMIEKQIWAAYHGEHFIKKAARVYAHTVVAHVRRATVGGISIENTHPFHHGRWIFAHNGTVPNFDQMRFKMLENMDPLHRSEIQGTTDSEHVFRYLLSLFLKHPEDGLFQTVRKGLNQIIKWSAEIDPKARVGLNIVLTDGKHLIGSRYNRSLYFLHRDKVFICPICGKSHVHHSATNTYQAIEIASEPVTHGEPWKEVPNGVVFEAKDDYRLSIEKLLQPKVRS
ncbi:class II glutamine amidotransferase [Pseudohalocynthiibacter aestuariivivens]|jgi:predicted glutamine amidotransferase|uniref:Class II glutamine amidotransferase n=1 Tax=Pseudohalocynthiibacter aestuariivivens TaxID=1591409 RepID=A0ABV5JEH0_9RHOB|nr:MULTISPECIES: class II glutamine amidotransferase [Pseudohalocynthiibacter]MBS9717749.1 class II glutamine amidotransferase [Pseudohalocynthiibacter aestuariivivens]MCK0104462.1 class II glutamine amidotransferase [Pseudohalocynthiibacter sp. F2068]